jgi:hypothetical protein
MTIIRDDSFESENAGYQLFTLVLSLYAIFVLLIQSLLRKIPGSTGFLDYADFVVCILFFGDFLYSSGARPTAGVYQNLGLVGFDLFHSGDRIARLGRHPYPSGIPSSPRLRATKQLTTLILRRRAETPFWL